jgi:hypothetical protein
LAMDLAGVVLCSFYGSVEAFAGTQGASLQGCSDIRDTGYSAWDWGFQMKM